MARFVKQPIEADNNITGCVGYQVIAMYDVIVDKKCLSSIVASVLEVYNKESSGFLIGSQSSKTIHGRKKKVVALKCIYPLQTAFRTPCKVEAGNVSAHRRAVGSLLTMNLGLVGEFHSHPDWHTRLSKSDIEYIGDEIKTFKNKFKYQMPNWLEMVVSVKKKEYSSSHSVGFSFRNYVKKVGLTVKTDPYTGYDVTLAGYWLSHSGGIVELEKEAKIYTV